MKFEDLARINVNKYVEKKNGLSFLSWAWAVDQLLRLDAEANWEYREPVRFGDTVMVFCAVTAFGRTRTAQLPVMDHRNKAILNPDAFQVNTAMQRCLAKAIALHGLGLYVYAGEDIPMEEKAHAEEELDAEAQALLKQLEAAAENGTAALELMLRKLPRGALKEDVWAKNSDVLKTMARLKDEASAPA